MGKYYLDGEPVEAKNLKGMCDQFYTSSYPSNSAYWQQAAIDAKFKAGDQQLQSVMYGDNAYYQGRRFFFNLCRRQSNMIVGFQRKNRKSTISLPIFQDDELSDQYNKVLKWCENRDGFQEYLSQAFEGAVDTGLNLLHLYPDYTLDPVSGDLFTDSVSYPNFMMDSYWRKQDLSDCNFIWRRRWITKVGAKALLPGLSDRIQKMQSHGAKDGRFPLQAELVHTNTNELMPYDEIHYRSMRKAKMIIDPKSGEAVEWEDDSEEEDMLQQVLQIQPWLIVKEMDVPTVKLVIQLCGEVLYHGPNLLNIDAYPFIPIVAYHQPDIQTYGWRIQGIIRNLRDAQYLYNRRKVIELDILESQINSGWIYPVDAVVDPKAFRQSGPGFLVPLKAGHLPQEIQRIEAPAIPQSMLELSRSLAEDLTQISGVNEELLGAADDDKAGILSMLRQGAGLTTLQTIFDKLDYSQRLYGAIRLQAIRKNFSKGKIAAITGQQPDPRFFSSNSLKYSIAVEEGNYATSQRQMELQQLLHFKQLGMPIADKSILRAAFIVNKKEVMDDMEQQQKQQQEQVQQQAQSQAQKDQAEMLLKQAQAKTEQARFEDIEAAAQEKLARLSEVKADTQYKRLEADLALVKEMIVLEDMDRKGFHEGIMLADQVRQLNTINSQQQQQEL